MSQKNKIISVLALFLMPFMAMAADIIPGTAGAEPMGGIPWLIEKAKDILGLLVPVLVTLALVYFIYGLGEYILESGTEAKKADGRTRMIWGTIALFCIVSIWGLVAFIQKTVGIDGVETVNAPKLMRE